MLSQICISLLFWAAVLPPTHSLSLLHCHFMLDVCAISRVSGLDVRAGRGDGGTGHSSMGSVAEPPPVPLGLALFYLAVVALRRHLSLAHECSGPTGF